MYEFEDADSVAADVSIEIERIYSEVSAAWDDDCGVVEMYGVGLHAR